MLDQKCLSCTKTFKDYSSNKRKYCSRPCAYSTFHKTYEHSCSECKKIFNNKKKQSKFCSLSCSGKSARRGKVPWNKGVKYLAISGSYHWNWKGGNRRGKRGAEQRRFRNAVLTRDNYKCVICGNAEGLVADHIKPYAYYPELREVIDNGRTLCKDCNYESTYISKDWSLA